jgi:RimJ/RimL family protein N-acetyltransferase
MLSDAVKISIENIRTNEEEEVIIAMCNPKNDASWKLLERLKFRREGFVLENIYFKQMTRKNRFGLIPTNTHF